MQSEQLHLSSPSPDHHASRNREGGDGALLRDGCAKNTASLFPLKEHRK